jgi:hypothetical protein
MNTVIKFYVSIRGMKACLISVSFCQFDLACKTDLGVYHVTVYRKSSIKKCIYLLHACTLQSLHNLQLISLFKNYVIVKIWRNFHDTFFLLPPSFFIRVSLIKNLSNFIKLFCNYWWHWLISFTYFTYFFWIAFNLFCTLNYKIKI